MGGHWEAPPAPGRVWVDARWVLENGEWLFYQGYWEPSAEPVAPVPVYDQPPPAEVTINIGPPPRRRAEPVPRQPGNGYIWVEGDWIWNGNQYIWSPGRWEAPRSGWVWVPPRWQAVGSRWQWRPGHWARR
jgi:hypothetical protein